ncbi:unnamed protein product [Brachionus calyciflorus]|uniref:HTH CENPB-type domain-containing protein n=1 Tax=Brachionus calyciflorus TaxID=104777 RepID=A0A814HSE3_9BILA|nr:unnamed protein product [Brachionus calyciflorus]
MNNKNKRSRNELKIEQKREIRVSCLSNKNKYLENESSNIFRGRTAMYPELENALFIWFHEKREHVAIISDEILIDKAKYFETMLNISNFKYSVVWINKLKKIYNISSYKLHSEAGSVDQNKINSERLKLQNELKGFNLDDIYNLNETALFFKMEPNKTLFDKKESGKKNR